MTPRKHRIHVEDRLEALGVPLLDLAATIVFVWQPESGDGWNEPREGGFAELSSVKQLTYLPIAQAALDAWAEAWLDEHHERVRQHVLEEAF